MLKYAIVFLLLFLRALGNPYDPNFPQDLNSRIKEWDEMAKIGELTVDDEGSYIDFDKNPQFAMMLNSPTKDAAYWESIYGPDDVPEFDEPPKIIGDSVYIDSVQSFDNYEPSFQKVKDAREFSKFEPIIEDGKDQAIPALQHAKKRSSTYEANRTSEWRNPLIPKVTGDQKEENHTPSPQEFEKVSNFNKNRRQIKRRKMVFNAAEENERVKRKNWANGHYFDHEGEHRGDESSNVHHPPSFQRYANFKNPYSFDFYPNRYRNYYNVRADVDETEPKSRDPILAHDFRGSEASKNQIEKAQSQHRVESVTRKSSEVSGKKENEFREMKKETLSPIAGDTSVIEKSEISEAKENVVNSTANSQKEVSKHQRSYVNNGASEEHQTMQVRKELHNTTTQNFAYNVSESTNVRKKDVTNVGQSKRHFNGNGGTEMASDIANFEKEGKAVDANWKNNEDEFELESRNGAVNADKSTNSQQNFEKAELFESGQKVKKHVDDSDQDCECVPPTLEKISTLTRDPTSSDEMVPENAENPTEESSVNVDEVLEPDMEDPSDAPEEGPDSVVNPEPTDAPEPPVTVVDNDLMTSLNAEPEEPIQRKLAYQGPLGPYFYGGVPIAHAGSQIPRDGLKRIGNFYVPLTDASKSPGNSLEPTPETVESSNKAAKPLEQVPRIETDPSATNAAPPGLVDPSSGTTYPLSPLSAPLNYQIPNELLNAAVRKAVNYINRIIEDARDECDTIGRPAINNKIINTAVEDAKEVIDEVAREIAGAKQLNILQNLAYSQSPLAENTPQIKSLQAVPPNTEGARKLDGVCWNRCVHCGSLFLANHDNRCPYYMQSLAKRYVTPAGNNFNQKMMHHLDYLNADIAGKQIPAGAQNFNKRYVNWDCNCSSKELRCPQCEYSGDNLTDIFETTPVIFDIIETNLNDGRNYANGMHLRAKSLASGGLHPKPHTASMLHFLNNKATDSIVQINQQSERMLFGLKFLRHQLYQRQVSKFHK